MSRPPSPPSRNALQADAAPSAPAPTTTETALPMVTEPAGPVGIKPRRSRDRRDTTSSSSSLRDTDDVRAGTAPRAAPSVTAAPAPPVDSVPPTGPGPSREPKTAASAPDPPICPKCGSGGKGKRNLVVCIDGTSNQFSKKNTNIVELYSRLVKDGIQLTFYNSGIGTYAKPSWKSLSYLEQVIANKLDLAFALRFEKIIISAYAWLVDNYQEGDRIFLFGFSRGAYQVRALAAMIDIVGLLHKGNNDQIPFAYELYADSGPREEMPSSSSPITQSRLLRRVFSYAEDVRQKLHDALSKVLPSRPAPSEVRADEQPPSTLLNRITQSRLVQSLSSHSKYLRQKLYDALAKVLPRENRNSATENQGATSPSKPLPPSTWSGRMRKIFGIRHRDSPHAIPRPKPHAADERPHTEFHGFLQWRFKRTFSRDVKVHYVGAWDTVSSVGFVRDKTLPGTTEGMQSVCYFRHALALHEYRVKFLPEYANGGNGPDEQATLPQDGRPPHTKEVWFTGSHSDIGGGSSENTSLDKFGPSLRWMSREATIAGLKFEDGYRQWVSGRVTQSMTPIWRTIEYLPIKRLSYQGPHSVSWWPHMCADRRIQEGQLVHQTVYEECEIDGLPEFVAMEPDEYTISKTFLISNPEKIWEEGKLLKDEELSQLAMVLSSEAGRESLGDLAGRINVSIGVMARFCQQHKEIDAILSERLIEELSSFQDRISYRSFNLEDCMVPLSTVLGTAPADPYVTYPFFVGGHNGGVSSDAFLSPQLVVSGSWDCTIRNWNVETGEAVSDPLTGHTDRINCVAVSPDGSLVASGSDDSSIRTWKFAAGKFVGEGLVMQADGMQYVPSVAFSPDGLRIVSGSGDRALRMWDAATGRQVGNAMEGHSDWVWSVAFSPDGARIASGSSDQTVRLWDAETLRPLGGPLIGHTAGMLSVAFSPDGVSIASGSVDETVRIWNADSRQLMYTLSGHSDSAWSISFSPSGRHIVSSSADKTVRIWDAVTGEAVGVLKGHTNWVNSVAFSPDGTRIASGSEDRTVRIWDRIPVTELATDTA